MFVDAKSLSWSFFILFYFLCKCQLALENTSELSKSKVDDLKLHCALAASIGKTCCKEYLCSEREEILDPA